MSSNLKTRLDEKVQNLKIVPSETKAQSTELAEVESGYVIWTLPFSFKSMPNEGDYNMADYQKMYALIFNAATDAINILQSAQIETEELFINQDEPNLLKHPDDYQKPEKS